MFGPVEFTIPGRPRAWARTGGNRGQPGVRFTPRPQRLAMSAIRKAYQAEAARARRNAPLSGAIKLEVLCVYAVPASWPRAKREAAQRGLVWKTSVPDCDNLGKLVSDALNGLAYSDDAIIAVCTVAKRYGSPERSVVRLTPLPAWEERAAEIGLPAKPAKPQGTLPL